MASGSNFGVESSASAAASSTRALHSAARPRSSAAADTPLASTQAPSKKAFDSRLIAEIDVPREANIVLVGGGVIGCAIASGTQIARQDWRENKWDASAH